MATNLKLASQLRETTDTLGAQLRAQREAQIKARQNAERAEIERQIKQAPLVAKQLIEGLPAFLQGCADAEYSSAYIVYRPGCKPWEHYFPNHMTPGRNTSYNENDMTEYAVRRYMKGTIQHVALWGLKQGFRVGLASFYDNRDREIESMARNHHEILPFYMPGMFHLYIPQSLNKDFLRFIW